MRRETVNDTPEARRLQECLGAGHVDVHGMPVVSLQDGRPVGVEVLARGRPLRGRLLVPAEFLPRVDEAGAWADLDSVVLTAVLDAVACLPRQTAIGVNLSAASLSRPDLADWILGATREAGVTPDRLHLELTERSVLRVDPRVTASMVDLSSSGVRWWVDDFGTGYSSISHLRDLPISGLKLDRSFTAGLTDHPSRNAVLAGGLAGLATGLGLDTVA